VTAGKVGSGVEGGPGPDDCLAAGSRSCHAGRRRPRQGASRPKRPRSELSGQGTAEATKASCAARHESVVCRPKEAKGQRGDVGPDFHCKRWTVTVGALAAQYYPPTLAVRANRSPSAPSLAVGLPGSGKHFASPCPRRRGTPLRKEMRRHPPRVSTQTALETWGRL